MARKSAGTLKRNSRLSPSEQVAARVNAQMKEDIVVVGSDPTFQIEKVTTGSLLLDRALLGGFARGRHVEIFGDWQVGKSLIVYMTLVEAQKRGEVCAIVDGEGVFDEAWFTQLGGDSDALIKYRPRTASQLAKVLQLFVQHDDEVRAVDIVGIDSVASMLPKEELAYDFEDGSVQPARLAALMSMLLRNVTTQNDKTLFVWTNQWRDKISHIPNLKSTPGGRSLAFYASTRIEMMQGEKENEEREVVHHGKHVRRKVTSGRWINMRLAKEKTGGRPEQSFSLMLDYDTKRLDVAREILDLGMEDGFVTRTGDYYNLHGEDEVVRVHGPKGAVARLRNDDDLRDFLIVCIEEQTRILAEGEDG